MASMFRPFFIHSGLITRSLGRSYLNNYTPEQITKFYAFSKQNKTKRNETKQNMQYS